MTFLGSMSYFFVLLSGHWLSVTATSLMDSPLLYFSRQVLHGTQSCDDLISKDSYLQTKYFMPWKVEAVKNYFHHKRVQLYHLTHEVDLSKMHESLMEIIQFCATNNVPGDVLTSVLAKQYIISDNNNTSYTNKNISEYNKNVNSSNLTAYSNKSDLTVQKNNALQLQMLKQENIITQLLVKILETSKTVLKLDEAYSTSFNEVLTNVLINQDEMFQHFNMTKSIINETIVERIRNFTQSYSENNNNTMTMNETAKELKIPKPDLNR